MTIENNDTHNNDLPEKESNALSFSEIPETLNRARMTWGKYSSEIMTLVFDDIEINFKINPN